MNISGAQLVVKALKAEGVDVLFAYPGGQAIDLFDVLFDQPEISVIVPRHEQALGHAADGYARSTGRVGVCLVTSGPGATNLVTAIATAHFDSIPLVCITGQVAQHLLGKHAFQEVDIVSVVRSICKHAEQVTSRDALADRLRRAFVLARSGKPGVVVVDIPKDIQQALGDATYPRADHGHDSPPQAAPGLWTGAQQERVELHSPHTARVDPTAQLRRASEALARSSRPLLLLGGGVKLAKATGLARELVERTGVPVVTTIMGRGAIPTPHSAYIGNLGIHGAFAANMAVAHCDLLLAIGTRFNDRITGRPETFAPDATIIHIDIDRTALSRNVPAAIPIELDARMAIAALLTSAEPHSCTAWRDEIAAWDAAHPLTMRCSGLSPEFIIRQIHATFPQSIVVTDVGQNQLWTTQYLPVHEGAQLLTPGGLGTMGFGLPAGLGAKIGNPDSDVVVVTGDGGMQMNGQELASAVREGLALTVCILNNGYLGNVRQWQELFYHKRYAGTCLGQDDAGSSDGSPDFVRLAESYGAQGLRVANTAEVAPALQQAKAHRTGPTVIDFRIAPELNVFPIVPPGKALAEMVLGE